MCPRSVVHDAIVIGSGPNGLAAAIALARSGASVQVLESHAQIGGGTRTAELTLPGYHHDVCSAAHPMAILSPFFRELDLERHGLDWVHPGASVAHPMPNGPAVLLKRSLEETCSGLGEDAEAYRRLLEPFLREPHGLLADLMGPLKRPRHPVLMARFGLLAIGIIAALYLGADAVGLVAGLSLIVPATVIETWRSRPPIDPNARRLDDDDPSWDRWNPWLARESAPSEEHEEEGW